MDITCRRCFTSDHAAQYLRERMALEHASESEPTIGVEYSLGVDLPADPPTTDPDEPSDFTLLSREAIEALAWIDRTHSTVERCSSALQWCVKVPLGARASVPKSFGPTPFVAIRVAMEANPQL